MFPCVCVTAMSYSTAFLPVIRTLFGQTYAGVPLPFLPCMGSSFWGACGSLACSVWAAWRIFFVCGAMLCPTRLHPLPGSDPDSPSRSGNSRSPSPRISRWSPERCHPFHDVVSRGECLFQVMCPFRGWGELSTITQATSHAEIIQAVYRDAGCWAGGYLFIGNLAVGRPAVVLPLAPKDSLLLCCTRWRPPGLASSRHTPPCGS